MQFSITTLAMAPMITGHPLGLPEAKRSTKSPFEIKPITKRGDIDTAIAEARTPAEFRRAVSGRPHPDQAAPPSMLQIRISQLLAEGTKPSQPSEGPAAEAAADADTAAGFAPATRDGAPIPAEAFPSGIQPVRPYPALPDAPPPQLDKAS